MGERCDSWQELFIRALDGAAEPQEESDLSRHIEGCPQCAAAARQLSIVHRMLLEASVEARITAVGSQPRRRPLLVVAAAAVLFATLAGGWLFASRTPRGTAGRVNSTGKKLTYGDELTNDGEEDMELALSDGSLLTVRTGSVVKVTASRRVTLTRGEVALQCRSNRANPFIIRAGDVEARAVGTRFSVGIEDEEETTMKRWNVSVAVMSGVVVVANSLGFVEAGEGARVTAVTGKPPAMGASGSSTGGPGKAEEPSERPASLADLAPARKDPLFSGKVSFEAVQKNLAGVLEDLAKKSGVAITCDPEFPNRLITLKMTNASPRLALEWIAALAGARWVVRTDECGTRSIRVTRKVLPADVTMNSLLLGGLGEEDMPYLLTYHADPEGFVRNLVLRIKKEVRPGNWKLGDGEIYVRSLANPTNRKPKKLYAIAVLQTTKGHEQIRKLVAPILARLRADHFRTVYEKTRARLAPEMGKQVSVNYERLALETCILDLKKRTTATVIVDSKLVKIMTRSVTFKATDKKLRKVLSAVLAQADPDLAWDYCNGAVFITTRKRLQTTKRRFLKLNDAAAKKSPAKKAPAHDSKKPVREVF